MIHSGLTEQQAGELQKKVCKELDELGLVNPEHRIGALLHVLWTDAEARGVGAARLGMMALAAWQRANGRAG